MAHLWVLFGLVFQDSGDFWRDGYTLLLQCLTDSFTFLLAPFFVPFFAPCFAAFFVPFFAPCFAAFLKACFHGRLP